MEKTDTNLLTGDRQPEVIEMDKERGRRGLLAINLGLGANIFLAAIKTTIGILGHSPALLADGVNSVSDVAYYIVISVFMHQANKPADEKHPYGHNQLESIAALTVGSFVVTTAVAIFWQSINDVFDVWNQNSDFTGAASSALWVALLTVVIKLGLTVFTTRLGKQTKNAAVLAIAYDHRNDVITATAATIGIFVGRRGILWFDPLAGALVALVILRTGIKILSDATENLMDAVPGKPLEIEIRKLLGAIPGIIEVEDIKAHRFGPYLVVNLTIGITGSISVFEGDCIATQAEASIVANIPFMKSVHIHYHPAQKNS